MNIALGLPEETISMNSVTNAMRAHILTAAVPYIKQYTDKYVVVKYGGNAMTDPGT